MCIRDSPLRAAVGAGGHGRGRRQRRQSAAGRGAVQAAGACLLYTSDAADDLLCVDLGGRRIIKKKKPLTTHMIQLRTNQNTQIMLLQQRLNNRPDN